MLITTDLLEDSTRGHDDSFLQIEKMLQSWNVLELAKATYAKSQDNRKVWEQTVKSATDEVRSDIALVINSIDDSMKGAWSKAVKEQAEGKSKKFEQLLVND